MEELEVTEKRTPQEILDEIETNVSLGEKGFNFGKFLADSSVLRPYLKKVELRNYFKQVGYEPYVWVGLVDHLYDQKDKVDIQREKGEDDKNDLLKFQEALKIAEVLGMGEVPEGVNNPEARAKLKDIFDNLVEKYGEKREDISISKKIAEALKIKAQEAIEHPEALGNPAIKLSPLDFIKSLTEVSLEDGTHLELTRIGEYEDNTLEENLLYPAFCSDGSLIDKDGKRLLIRVPFIYNSDRYLRFIWPEELKVEESGSTSFEVVDEPTGDCYQQIIDRYFDSILSEMRSVNPGLEISCKYFESEIIFYVVDPNIQTKTLDTIETPPNDDALETEEPEWVKVARAKIQAHISSTKERIANIFQLVDSIPAYYLTPDGQRDLNSGMICFRKFQNQKGDVFYMRYGPQESQIFSPDQLAKLFERINTEEASFRALDLSEQTRIKREGDVRYEAYLSNERLREQFQSLKNA